MRIRTIKPEFWTNEKLCSLHECTHMFAAALLNYVDDEGYFNANPGLIKGALFPIRETSRSIPDMLHDLSKIGFLKLGETDDERKYGLVINFRKHQFINKPSASKIKGLDISWYCTEPLRENYCSATEPLHGSSCSATIGKGSGNKEQGTGNRDISAHSRGTCTYSKEFEDFRAQYPKHRHGGKQQDWASWKVAKSKGMTADQANEYLAYWKKCPKWQKNGGEFIVAISKWLRGGFWEDMPPDYEPGNSSQYQQHQPKKTQHDLNMEFLRKEMAKESEKKNRHRDYNDDTRITVRNLPGEIPDEY